MFDTPGCCTICGRTPDSPYRVFSDNGRTVLNGCVAKIHDGHLIAGTSSARFADEAAARYPGRLSGIVGVAPMPTTTIRRRRAQAAS